MADLSPVSPGEPFRLLDADVCNVLFAMAREWQSKRMGRTGNGTSSGTQGDPISVIMQNRSGSALDQYAIVGISDALIPYADSATEFKRRPQFRATAPTATGPFAVLQQPLANYVSDSTPNTIGRAVIAGVTICKVNITDAAHNFAKPSTSLTELTSAPTGLARILARESGTGTKFAYVLLGTGEASGGGNAGGCCTDEVTDEYHPTDNPFDNTFEIRRPFGAGSATTSGLDCRLISDFTGGQLTDDDPSWTHVLICDSAVDVRDGCSRTTGSNAITYADGDEVRIPSGASSPRFVVVWVESVNKGESGPDLYEYKRVFLMRHSA